MRPGTRVALGLGCDRGTPPETIEAAVAQALAQAGAGWDDVAAAASIELKADEAGLLALARRRGWALRFYAAAELAAVPVPNPSETVRRYTGTPSVSEAAALLAAGAAGAIGAAAAIGVTAATGEAGASATRAAGPDALLVEKHKHRGPDGRHATVSVARINP